MLPSCSVRVISRISGAMSICASSLCLVRFSIISVSRANSARALKPDFVRVRRTEIYDTEGNVFR